MKYIEKLTLENFEGWVKGEIPFTKGFNVIIGDSDSGKSSLFRAIESIFTGKVAQENVNRNAKNLKVELQLSDGSKFTREYGKKGNKISFDNTTFERIGREIPSEYIDKLGKSYVDISDKNRVDLCLYSQFDPHFFINFSDYDKSKLIGTICGIGSIDKLIDAINKDIRENNFKIKVLNEQITEKEPRVIALEEDYKQEKEKFDLFTQTLNNYKADLTVLETCFNAFNQFEEYDTKVSEIKEKIKGINELLNVVDMPALKAFEQLALTYVDYQSAQAKISDLTAQIKSVKTVAEYQLETTQELQQLSALNADLTRLNSKTNDLSAQLEKAKILADFDTTIFAEFDQLVALQKRLKISNEIINAIVVNKERATNKLLALEQEKKDLLKEYKTCPLCGGIINEK